MKKVLTILFTLISFFSFAQASSVIIDLSESKVEWTGKKIMGEHTGNIDLLSAKLEFGGKVLTGGTFELDMESITCTDLEKNQAEKLLGQLKGEDFFNVSIYKKAVLKFVKVRNIEGNSYRIIADLTIKGTTQSIEFTANLREHEAIALLKVDRANYDVRYGSANFFNNIGNNVIDDIFEVKVNLVY
jgi:polyisoprenoid-binding protein YceI